MALSKEDTKALLQLPTDEPVPFLFYGEYVTRLYVPARKITYMQGREEKEITSKASYVMLFRQLGWAVFAAEPVTAGDVVGFYTGELINTETDPFMSRRQLSHFLGMVRYNGASNMTIDGSQHGEYHLAFFAKNGVGSFFNSSVEPNCMMRVVPGRADTSCKLYAIPEVDKRMPAGHLPMFGYLVANSDIRRGAQLTWNYRTVSSGDIELLHRDGWRGEWQTNRFGYLVDPSGIPPPEGGKRFWDEFFNELKEDDCIVVDDN